MMATVPEKAEKPTLAARVGAKVERKTITAWSLALGAFLGALSPFPAGAASAFLLVLVAYEIGRRR
jgi:hypothetical protein